MSGWKKLKRVYWAIASLVLVVLISIACSNRDDVNPLSTQTSPPVEQLNIWWEQGLNLDEDEAIRGIVNDWHKKTGKKVKLSFYPNSNFIDKVERAIQAGNPPDILMIPRGESILYPRLAWLGKLADVSALIQPISDRYSENILKGITYYNARDKKSSYYGVPIYQMTMGIYYWKSLLASIGLNPQDIPRDWDEFWQFWQQAQIKLNQQGKDVYGLGFTLSGEASTNDTHQLFEQILEAYNLSLLDKEGNLSIDSYVFQGIRDRLVWYADLYRRGFIPPDAVKWTNTDNNRTLLNQSVLMTPNRSLSIPATVRQDRDTYKNKLGMVEFPRKPNGKPMRHIISIAQAVIFQNSPHQPLAQDFLRYFIQPQISVRYLKATGSRNQPVQNSVWLDPYWQNTKDPYMATITDILTGEHTRLSYIIDNPAYSQVLAENVWGKAIIKVTTDKMNPDRATDEAIARIKNIFDRWHNLAIIQE